MLFSLSSAFFLSSFRTRTASQRPSYPLNIPGSARRRLNVEQNFSTFAESCFPGRRRTDSLAWNSARWSASMDGHGRDARGRTPRLSRSRACAVALMQSSCRDVLGACVARVR